MNLLQLKGENEAKDKHLLRLKGENEAKDKHLLQLKGENEAKDKHLLQLKGENEAKDKHLLRLKGENEAKDKHLLRLKGENEAKDKYLQNLRSEIKTYNQQLQQLQNQMEVIKTKVPEESARLSTSSYESKVSNKVLSKKSLITTWKLVSLKEKKIKEKVIDHMTAVLTDHQLIWEEFFSGVVTDAVEEKLVEDLKAEKLSFTHSMVTVYHPFNLPLKLILTPLQRGICLANTFASKLEMQFGPLHAALQVGNVILEWNDSHLVSPYLCDYEDEFHVMKVDMQPHSEWVDYTTTEAAEKLDFTEQIDQIYMVTSKKKEMIDDLIDVIVRYNKHYYIIVRQRDQGKVGGGISGHGVTSDFQLFFRNYKD